MISALVSKGFQTVLRMFSANLSAHLLGRAVLVDSPLIHIYFREMIRCLHAYAKKNSSKFSEKDGKKIVFLYSKSDGTLTKCWIPPGMLAAVVTVSAHTWSD